jgi:hypothetical protein
MKKAYLKPSVSFIELRLEERIADCGQIWIDEYTEVRPCRYVWGDQS